MGDMDTAGFVPVGEWALLQPWMAFELVHSGLDFGVLDESFHFGFGEVGDADDFCFAGWDELFHCSPCLKRLVSFLNQVRGKDGATYIKPVSVLYDDISVRVFGKKLRVSLPGHGPMNHEHVHVVQTQFIERVLKRTGNIVGVV